MSASYSRGLWKALPSPVRKLVKAPIVYWRRLMIWKKIISNVRFVSGPSGNTLFRSALLSPITSLRNLGSWENPLLLGDATVESKGIGKFHIRAYSDELFCVIPAHEASVEKAIRTCLKPGDVFVDAGANIGVYTVLGSRMVGPTGKVVSIEMMPDTAARLKDHVALNELENATIIECALSNVSGDKVTATVPEGFSGQASIAVRKTGRSVQVETDTLSNILVPYPKIRLMKLDVEGAEGIALEGAREVLDRIEAIVLENWGDDFDVSPMLVASGFIVQRLDGRNLLAVRQHCS